MKQYTCKTCEAELYWDSKTKKLKCEYCDSTFDPHEFDEDVDVEQKAEKADIHDKADDDSFGIDLVKYKCTECGAELVTAAGTVATTCAYCGRAISMTSKMEGEFKPDVVIPFAVTKEDAKKKETRNFGNLQKFPKFGIIIFTICFSDEARKGS